MIIYGKRLCGRVDRVPGVLYVATQFFHLYFIPVAPVHSFVIIEGSEGKDGFKGVKTRLSVKSIVATYCRTLLFLGGSIMLIVGALQACNRASDGPSSGDSSLGLLVFPVLGLMSICACIFWRPWSLATEQHTHELAALLGIQKDTLDAWLLERKHTMLR